MTLDFSTVININLAKQKYDLSDPFKERIFSVEQQEEMNQFFEMLQIDDTISASDLIHIIKILNYQISMRRFRSILQEITMTMNIQTKTPITLVTQTEERFIDYKAFMEIMIRVDTFHRKDRLESEELERSLRIYRKDNIYVDTEFINHVMKHIGDKVTDEEFDRLIDELVYDDNGRTKFKDLFEILTNK